MCSVLCLFAVTAAAAAAVQYAQHVSDGNMIKVKAKTSSSSSSSDQDLSEGRAAAADQI